jgi:DNA-binding transcriptional MerR regulator
VSRRQLERWRNAGLLPPLAVRGKGRGRGQERYYADDPTSQFAALLELRKSDLPVAECAVRLWLDDFPIELDVVRYHFPLALRGVKRFRGYLSNPAFADKFAEYLERRPSSRAAWFGDNSWSPKRYEKAREAMTALQSENPTTEQRGALRELAAKFINLNSDEKALIENLATDINVEIYDRMPSLIKETFEALDADDIGLPHARDVLHAIVQLGEVANAVAQRMPNPVSSLIARSMQLGELTTSYGLFLAIGSVVIAGDIDILSNMKALIETLRGVQENLDQAKHVSTNHDLST